MRVNHEKVSLLCASHRKRATHLSTDKPKVVEEMLSRRASTFVLYQHTSTSRAPFGRLDVPEWY